MARTWIFQANPSRFDINGFFATHPTATAFLVTRYRQEIAVGDQVFVWRSIGGGNQDSGGIIAEGEVIEPPSLRPDTPNARGFWSDPNEADVPAERVVLNLKRIANNREIIRRRWMLEDPILSGLTILRMANATNYELDDAQAVRLNALWSRTGRDWSYAESIAGLWAYYRTYGGEVSQLPGSPVAEIALMIGRVVGGVYNKVMNFRSIDPRDQRTGMTGGGATDRRVWTQFYDEATGELDGVQLKNEFHRLWTIGFSSAVVGDVGGSDEAMEVEAQRLCDFSLDILMNRYDEINKDRRSKPPAKSATVRQFVRNPLIVAIGKVRAGFQCEVPHCSHSTFIDIGNRPYCEVHHIVPLADGGNDDLDNVACLCPAHHREVHFGKTAEHLRMVLTEVRIVIPNEFTVAELKASA